MFGRFCDRGREVFTERPRSLRWACVTPVYGRGMGRFEVEIDDPETGNHRAVLDVEPRHGESCACIGPGGCFDRNVRCLWQRGDDACSAGKHRLVAARRGDVVNAFGWPIIGLEHRGANEYNTREGHVGQRGHVARSVAKCDDHHRCHGRDGTEYHRTAAAFTDRAVMEPGGRDHSAGSHADRSDIGWRHHRPHCPDWHRLGLHRSQLPAGLVRSRRRPTSRGDVRWRLSRSVDLRGLGRHRCWYRNDRAAPHVIDTDLRPQQRHELDDEL